MGKEENEGNKEKSGKNERSATQSFVSLFLEKKEPSTPLSFLIS